MQEPTTFKRVSLEAFVAKIPQRSDVVYVGQRQSGRSLAIDVINLIQRIDGDPTEVVPYHYVRSDEGDRKAHPSPEIGHRCVIYKGQKHKCSFGRLAAESDEGKKNVYQISPKDFRDEPILGLPVVWVTPVEAPNGSVTTLLKTQQQDGTWLLSAFAAASEEPFGALGVTDASSDLVSVAVWLSKYNLVPTDGTAITNPYWLSEEEYVRLLSRMDLATWSVGPGAFKHLMAQEFLGVSKGFVLECVADSPDPQRYEFTAWPNCATVAAG